MRFLTAEVTNFGSYDYLKFDFNNQGLALIHGATGSGKSTLQDIIGWILYGQTSKNGSVDDVRRWGSEEITSGTLAIESNGTRIIIQRSRGSARENDLYWSEAGLEHRGKDIRETQALFEKRLGASAELYQLAATYNEFSPTSTFFTAKAKDRRELFEKIADLSLPVKLGEGASNARKLAKKSYEETEKRLISVTAKLSQAQKAQQDLHRLRNSWADLSSRTIASLEQKAKNFEEEKQAKIKQVEKKSQDFEELKQENIQILTRKIVSTALQLEELGPDNVCDKCGQKREDVIRLTTSLQHLKGEVIKAGLTYNSYTDGIVEAKALKNHYLEQLEVEKTKSNPYDAQSETFDEEIEGLKVAEQLLTIESNHLDARVNGLEQLYDLSLELRGLLLMQAVKGIEAETNRLLERYFDSEIRVRFELDGDKLEISLQKSGYDCSYGQLSKGQRSLLKLCFSLSVMQAAENSGGTHFNALCLDEPTDGLDEMLKVKAFTLFQELSLRYESVLVIEHSSELKNMFEKQYHVTIESDVSKIKENL